jgi:hypothetical protein
MSGVRDARKRAYRGSIFSAFWSENLKGAALPSLTCAAFLWY